MSSPMRIIKSKWTNELLAKHWMDQRKHEPRTYFESHGYDLVYEIGGDATREKKKKENPPCRRTRIWKQFVKPKRKPKWITIAMLRFNFTMISISFAVYATRYHCYIRDDALFLSFGCVPQWWIQWALRALNLFDFTIWLSLKWCFSIVFYSQPHRSGDCFFFSCNRALFWAEAIAFVI